MARSTNSDTISAQRGSGLEARYRTLGYALTPEELARVSLGFSELADRGVDVLDEDLLSILHTGAMDDVPERHRIAALDVQCGADVSKASVVIESEEGPSRRGHGSGAGPIAAAFTALENLLDFRVVVQDLEIRGATPGGEGAADVSVRAAVDGHTFTGQGSHRDMVRASVDAYLHAVNKAANARVLEEDHLAETSDAWGV